MATTQYVQEQVAQAKGAADRALQEWPSEWNGYQDLEEALELLGRVLDIADAQDDESFAEVVGE